MNMSIISIIDLKGKRILDFELIITGKTKIKIKDTISIIKKGLEKAG
jgi:hypothetical protein